MHSSKAEEYLHLKKHTPFALMADESVTHEADFDLIQNQFHGVNMKLMKAGGYLSGIKILNETRKRGMKTMIGCMVETSLGISSAIRLCTGIDFIDLDGSLILKEDPFGLIREQDGILFLNDMPA
jgi:L-alanine-DL-glutamate epimerase-like enolase superfamily enzyme